MSADIDRINLLEMRNASSFEHQVSFGGFFPAERAALEMRRMRDAFWCQGRM